MGLKENVASIYGVSLSHGGMSRAVLVISISCVNANSPLPRGLVVPCASGSL